MVNAGFYFAAFAVFILTCAEPWAHAGRCESAGSTLQCKLNTATHKLGTNNGLTPVGKGPGEQDPGMHSNEPTLTFISDRTSTLLPTTFADGAASGGPRPDTVTKRHELPFEQQNTIASTELPLAISETRLYKVLDNLLRRDSDFGDRAANFQLCCYGESKCVKFDGLKEAAFCYNPKTYIFELPNGAQGNLLTRKIKYRNGTEGDLSGLGEQYEALTISTTTTTTPLATSGFASKKTKTATGTNDTLPVVTFTVTATATATPSPFTDERSSGTSRISGVKRLMQVVAAGWVGFAALCMGNVGRREEPEPELPNTSSESSSRESFAHNESGAFYNVDDRDARFAFNSPFGDESFVRRLSQGHLSTASGSEQLIPTIAKMPRGVFKLAYQIRRFFARKPYNRNHLSLAWDYAEEKPMGVDFHWDTPPIRIQDFGVFRVCQCPVCGSLMPTAEFHAGGALPAVYEDGGIEYAIPMKEFLEYVVREGFEGYVMVKEPVSPLEAPAAEM
ncbi:hypothetical protein DFH27DRAFT_334706 [Peziza echinospora]|nr:hypothetical protein DFH27DRAFT_334706 [Peziza echinospora]